MKGIHDKLRKYAEKSSSEAFQRLVTYFDDKITDDLSIIEVAQIIRDIETITVGIIKTRRGIKRQDIVSLRNYISYISKKEQAVFDEQDLRTFNQQGSPYTLSSELLNLIVDSTDQVADNQNFINDIVAIHDFLLDLFKQLLNKHKNLKPSCPYTPQRLSRCSEFYRLEEVSKREAAPDSSTIAIDVIRGSVLFDGKEVIDVHPQSIFNTIETMTADKVHIVGTKANKIYNFGGQFLHHIATHELHLATILDEQLLVPTSTKHQLNWRKSFEGKVEAEVSIDVFAFLDGHSGNYFMVNTAGSGLVKVNTKERRGEEVIAGLSNSMENSYRLPVASVRLVIGFENAKNGHYLTVKKAEVKHHVPELKGFRSPESTINTLNKMDLNNREAVSTAENLLDGFDDAGWEYLMHLCTDSVKEKFVELFFKAQMFDVFNNNNMLKLAFYRSRLIEICGSEENFNDYLNKIEKKYKITETIENFNNYFTELKTATPNLSLELLVSLPCNDLVKTTSERGVLRYIISKLNQEINLDVTALFLKGLSDNLNPWPQFDKSLKLKIKNMYETTLQIKEYLLGEVKHQPIYNNLTDNVEKVTTHLFKQICVSRLEDALRKIEEFKPHLNKNEVGIVDRLASKFEEKRNDISRQQEDTLTVEMLANQYNLLITEFDDISKKTSPTFFTSLLSQLIAMLKSIFLPDDHHQRLSLGETLSEIEGALKQPGHEIGFAR